MLGSTIPEETGIPYAHHVLDTVVNALSIFLNGILIYLVCHYSDFREKTYKWLLLVSAVIDFALSIFAMITQPIFMPSGEYCIVASNGFFRHWSYTYSAVILTCHYGTLHFSSVWTAVQFVFRKNLLCANGSGKTTRLVIFVTILTLVWATAGYLVHAAVFFGNTDTETAIQVLRNNSWPATMEEGGPAAPYVYQFGNPLWSLFIFCWTSTSCMGFSLIVWSEIRIAQHYKRIGEQLRNSTRHLHSEIHRALLAMAICPVITSDMPILYLMAALICKWHPGGVSSFVETSTSSITFWNPIMTIVCIRCYRQVITKPLSAMFGKARGRVSTAPPTGLHGTTLAGMSVLLSNAETTRMQ